MSNAYFYVRIIVTYFSQSARYRATRGGENNKTLPLPSPCALLLPPFSSLSHPLFVFALSFIRFVIPRKIFHVRSDVSVHDVRAVRRNHPRHVPKSIAPKRAQPHARTRHVYRVEIVLRHSRFAQVVSRVDHFFRVWVSRRSRVFRQASIAPVARDAPKQRVPHPHRMMMSPVEIIPRIRDSHERVLQKRRKNEAAEELQFPAVSLDDLFRAVARHFFLSFEYGRIVSSRVLCYIFERIFSNSKIVSSHFRIAYITRAENIFEEALSSQNNHHSKPRKR